MTIDAARFAEMMQSGAALLENNKQHVNDLNVFPVPDGDTGSNMSCTINTGIAELAKLDAASLSLAADKFASALLRGARGNSGVILSLLFRGISKGLKGKDAATAAEFAASLKEGVAAAYNAVMRPTEGTILTVARVSSDAAVAFAAGNDDLIALLERTIEVAAEALAETTDQNPVLKKAGVIDAGGEGYLLLLKGMLAALNGEPVAFSGEVPTAPAKNVFDVFETENITFAFDTVFIVRKTGKKSLDPLRHYLNGIGDSLVIGEDDEAFKVHVHTNVPGDALNAAQKYGTLELAKIENMRTQHDDVAAGRKAHTTDDLDDEEALFGPAAPEKPYGFVSVCAGEGMHELFRELGVDAVVDGGQTMNPSTADILKAVNSVPAETVFVLPNNKNIIMAAEQCAPLTAKKVVVIHSKTIPQGITAMYNFDDSLTTDELTGIFENACTTVHTALITNAVRDSGFDGASIREGEYLALLDGTLIANTFDLNAALAAVADAFAAFDPDIISIYRGVGADEASAAQAEAVFDKKLPGAEITLLDGGQPVYVYILSAE